MVPRGAVLPTGSDEETFLYAHTTIESDTLHYRRLEIKERSLSSLSARVMSAVDEVFRKATAQDDKGLEEEVKALLGGTDVVLEKEYFAGKYLDGRVAPAVLIHEKKGDGVIHSRAAEGKIDILPTGPKAADELRILILNDGRTGLVFRDVLIRRFVPGDS
ncbi:hypothetical protein EMCG_08565 [[Emmonsia] crescens]|uniref:Uncharacterized protein n=1 Tax=[Emmonsia] crescens TaxID=73230 RepID=A0A0G2JAE7_9EURO|nr:hypothetical protein EMCG_08565 [Emmonsia crescens UAMH 3008]